MKSRTSLLGIFIFFLILGISRGNVSIVQQARFPMVFEQQETSVVYTIALAMAPLDTVTVQLTVLGQPPQVYITGSPVQFTPADWTPRTVTVIAVDDTDVELNPHTALIRHTVVSLDGRFDGYEVDDVLIKIVDNDAPLAGYRLEDFDSSGRVELKDLSLMAGDWLEGPVSWFDVTGDLEVDIEDLEQMAFNWLAPSEPEIEIQAICEYTQNPLGVDTPTPHLSWKIETSRRNLLQSAYQVLVATSEAMLNETQADVWNSGKVSSAKPSVLYQGAALESGKKYYWVVRIWDGEDTIIGTSAASFWTMGLLAPTDWGATWINDGRPNPATDAAFFSDDPAPLFRKEFSVTKSVIRATLYISGLGYYLAGINGEPVSDAALETGWTSYAVRVPYRTWDVTNLLQSGNNCLGVTLGNGWYNPRPIPLFCGANTLRTFLTIGRPRLIARLQIDYTDGTSSAVVSDTSWKVAQGPLMQNDVYMGTKYDARLEIAGWDLPGFNDAGWSSAAAAAETVGPLRSDLVPPVRVTRELDPVSVTQPVAGTYIFDFGQNFSGVCRLHIPSATAGTQVQMRMGELLNADGTLDDRSTLAFFVGMYCTPAPFGRADQKDIYLCKAGGPQTYTPPFTFHGFRYVEVIGYPGTPDLAALEGLRMNNDVENVGEFACSNPLLSKLWDMYDWTLKGNLFSIQSDCPGREKFGYGGDIVTSSEASMLGRDMSNFYRKSIRDLQDAVRSNGGLAETAPYVGIATGGFGDGSGPVGWGTAHPLLLKQLRQYYGNEDLLAEQYETLKGWVDLLEANDTNYIISVGLSDHMAVYEKVGSYVMPTSLTSTAHYYYNARTCSEIAGLLGYTTDEAYYAELADNIKDAFNNTFFDSATGRYNTGTIHVQTCQAFALYYDLVPDGYRDLAINVLIDNIRTNTDYPNHLTTGIFGTKFMLDQLMKADKAYIAYTAMNQRTYPGYGNWVDNLGATSILQQWNGSATRSQSHPMFGSVVEWEMKCLAGILPADDAIGFDKIIIKPHLIGDLDWACGSYDSIRGLVESSWHVFEGVLYLDVTVPANTAATIYVPAADVADVTESGIPAVSALGLTYTGMADNRAVFAAGSGRYRFMSTSPVFSGDNAPPSPANCVWAVEPYAASFDSVSMEVSPAVDESGVEYYFDCLTAGGHDSVWQEATTYTDIDLQNGTEYTYRVKARDKISHLENGYSVSRSATTPVREYDPPTPNPATFASAPAALNGRQITMTATVGSDATGPIEYYFDETSGNAGGTDSGWQTDPTYLDAGLSPLTTYTYTVRMRDGWDNVGTASTPVSATTPALTEIMVSSSGYSLAGVNGQTTATFSVSNGGTTSNYLIISAVSETVHVTGITVAGQAMTQLLEEVSSSGKVEFYGLVNPPAGGTVIVTYSGSIQGGQIYGYAYLDGVNPSNPVRSSAKQTLLTGTATVVLNYGTVDPGDFAMLASNQNSKPGASSVSPSDAVMYAGDAGASFSGMVAYDAGLPGGSYSSNFTFVGGTAREVLGGVILASE